MSESGGDPTKKPARRRRAASTSRASRPSSNKHEHKGEAPDDAQDVSEEQRSSAIGPVAVARGDPTRPGSSDTAAYIPPRRVWPD